MTRVLGYTKDNTAITLITTPGPNGSKTSIVNVEDRHRGTSVVLDLKSLQGFLKLLQLEGINLDP